MANSDLVKFIQEARRRGFNDYKIREALMSNGWTSNLIDEAFASIKPSIAYKNKVEIYLDSEVLKKISQRAKKNMFTLPEQIEDILRRSVVNVQGKSKKQEKLDDMLVGLFSRKTKKRKR